MFSHTKIGIICEFVYDYTYWNIVYVAYFILLQLCFSLKQACKRRVDPEYCHHGMVVCSLVLKNVIVLAESVKACGGRDSASCILRRCHDNRVPRRSSNSLWVLGCGSDSRTNGRGGCSSVVAIAHEA